MDGYKSRIGKSQMRQYMGELYEDCMVVYREYIQNACDSIEDAVAAGLITDRKKTTIIVNIDTYNHTISIEDKGIGIPSDKIGPYLVDVASSAKSNTFELVDLMEPIIVMKSDMRPQLLEKG